MTERQYLPTFAELVDRLSIVLLKMIFIPEHREAYKAERDLILHDIDLALQERGVSSNALDTHFCGPDIWATLVIMLSNRFIWENEGSVRAGQSAQDGQLRTTHVINGVRNAAKNVLAQRAGERMDLKTDCLAADLPPEFGNWQVF